MEIFYILIIVVPTQVYIFVKTHQKLHLKWVYLILLLNNVDLKLKQQTYIHNFQRHI